MLGRYVSAADDEGRNIPMSFLLGRTERQERERERQREGDSNGVPVSVVWGGRCSRRGKREAETV